MNSYSVVPPSKVTVHVVKLFNATLSNQKLVENTDKMFSIGTEALYNNCLRNMKLTNPSYGDLNYFVSLHLLGQCGSPGFVAQTMQLLVEFISKYPKISKQKKERVHFNDSDCNNAAPRQK